MEMRIVCFSLTPLNEREPHRSEESPTNRGMIRWPCSPIMVRGLRRAGFSSERGSRDGMARGNVRVVVKREAQVADEEPWGRSSRWGPVPAVIHRNTHV